MKPQTSMEWQMLLKSCPDTEFIKFFEDNPAVLYVADIARAACDESERANL